MSEESRKAAGMKRNLRKQKNKRGNWDLVSNATLNAFFQPSNISFSPNSKLIFLKYDNKGSIALVYNSVHHAQTNNINFQHKYICDKIASRLIAFQYIPTSEMIFDALKKAVTYTKFDNFFKQIYMNWQKGQNNWTTVPKKSQHQFKYTDLTHFTGLITLILLWLHLLCRF